MEVLMSETRIKSGSPPLARLGLVAGTALVLLTGFALLQPEPSRGAPVAKAHETSLACGQEFHAGSSAAFRCGVHSVKSLTETVPLVGAEVQVEMRSKDGKTYPLHRGKTSADGWDKTELKIPPVAAGPYTLTVVTRSRQGEEKLEKNVQVKSGAKVLLVTDKPLYQPGQVMYIRALSLQPFDLKPVAGADL